MAAHEKPAGFSSPALLSAAAYLKAWEEGIRDLRSFPEQPQAAEVSVALKTKNSISHMQSLQ